MIHCMQAPSILPGSHNTLSLFCGNSWPFTLSGGGQMPGKKGGEYSMFQQLQTPIGYSYYNSSLTSYSILTIFFPFINQNLDCKNVVNNYELLPDIGTILSSPFLSSSPLHYHTPPRQHLTPRGWHSLDPRAVSKHPEKSLPREMDNVSPIINTCQNVIDQRALNVYYLI